ncbi:MAG: 50S ribosome-binding GTPase [Syntrophobacterales bacterium]|nr:50S ribosome-binding GTPase [Syntrophobacterales bacterium]
MIEEMLKRTQWSGFTLPLNAFKSLYEKFSFCLAVENDRREIPFFWIAVIGGTGTGKSTIFNSLAGTYISTAGVERPKTKGPIAAFPKGKGKIKLRCFTTIDTPSSTSYPLEGSPGVLTITEHLRDLPWVFVDSPDIDSLARDHHRMAEDIFSLSDFILFILSQEKYADERLNRFLRRVIEENKSFFVIVNKVSEELQPHEVLHIFRLQGFHVDRNSLIMIPFARPEKGQLRHLEAWNEVERRLNALVREDCWKEIRNRENERSKLRMAAISREMALALKREKEALTNLVRDIKVLAERSVYEVLENHIATVRDHTKTHLQPQIKALYSRYDIFVKPRKTIGQAISKVLELLGIELSEGERNSKEETLKLIEKQIDHSPVFYAMDFLVNEVLKRVPTDRKPLSEVLRSRQTVLSREDIQNLMFRNSQDIFDWLENKFQTLMEGIPKTKELGIYSSFALWGIFILGIEAAIGGGLSLVKATIDAIIAPFITKATVEFFASREMHSIVEELSNRYKRGLQSIIFLQRDRFIDAITPFIPEEGLIKALENVELRND